MLTGLFALIPFAMRGAGLGLAIAAPVGPIGVLCIRRTLVDGRLLGFVTGLGAATADAFYGGLAAFGVSVVPMLLSGARVWIHLIGAVVIAWLGIRSFVAKPGIAAPSMGARAKPSGGIGQLATAWVTTLGLTMTNPTTIVTFAALFAGIGLASSNAPIPIATATMVGVFLGSALWWLVLSYGVSLARTTISLNAMRWVNRVSGVTLCVFAVYALVSL